MLWCFGCVYPRRRLWFCVSAFVSPSVHGICVRLFATDENATDATGEPDDRLGDTDDMEGTFFPVSARLGRALTAMPFHLLQNTLVSFAFTLIVSLLAAPHLSRSGSYSSLSLVVGPRPPRLLRRLNPPHQP